MLVYGTRLKRKQIIAAFDYDSVVQAVLERRGIK